MKLRCPDDDNFQGGVRAIEFGVGREVSVVWVVGESRSRCSLHFRKLQVQVQLQSLTKSNLSILKRGTRTVWVDEKYTGLRCWGTADG